MYNSSNLSVGRKAIALTPSNSANFSASVRAVYVGVGGNIVLVNPDSTTCTLVDVPQGTIVPTEAIRVNSTGTTASSLVGFV